MARTSIFAIVSEVEKTTNALLRYQAEIPPAGEHLPGYESLLARMRRARMEVDDLQGTRRTAARELHHGPEKRAEKLYRQVRLQLEAHYDDPNHPKLQELLLATPTDLDTPSEWLEGLERQRDILTKYQADLPFAAARLVEIEATLADLRAGIEAVADAEGRLGRAVKEWKGTEAAYRAARATLRRKLQAHFGSRNDPRLHEFFS